MRVAAALIAGLLSATAAHAAPAWQRLSGDWVQGDLIVGRVAPGSAVRFQDRAVRVADDGRFVVGLDRDEASSVSLVVTPAGAAAQAETHAVKARHYDIQRLNGLPPDKVTPPPEVTERIAREQAQSRQARMIDSDRVDFAGPYRWPATGRISGVYGSQRILNGEKKQPHYGVDVAVPVGTPVQAPAGGVVTLAEPDLYYTGGTLMIDHGHGVTSAFLHLSQLKVQVGDAVHAGDVIALSGVSGRATGPHLDWRVSWFDARVDPQRLVTPMAANAASPAGDRGRGHESTPKKR